MNPEYEARIYQYEGVLDVYKPPLEETMEQFDTKADALSLVVSKLSTLAEQAKEGKHFYIWITRRYYADPDAEGNIEIEQEEPVAYFTSDVKWLEDARTPMFNHV